MKNAVVTGASRGLGLEICRQLHQNSAYQKVYALCRQPTPELTALVESSKQRVAVIANINVMQDNVGGILKKAFCTSDGAIVPIDLLVHNAGAYGPPESFPSALAMYESQTLENVTPERMMYSFQLNALAPLFVTRALLPNLRVQQHNESKVIIVSSAMGSIADNTSGGHYGYRSAKAAVNMIGKSLAEDLKDAKIAVGFIHPGFVLTGFDGGAERRPGQRDADESVRGVLQAVEQVTLESTGCFLHGNYGEGVKPLAW